MLNEEQFISISAISEMQQARVWIKDVYWRRKTFFMPLESHTIAVQLFS